MFKHTTVNGNDILIDDEDRDILLKYHISTMKPKNSYTRYVVCTNLQTTKYEGLLHRKLLNIKDRKILIDHEDGNGLNCCKENLRICNSSENQQNRRLTKLKNEVKGLQFREDRGYWVAKITINNKQIALGAFHLKEDAIIARLKAETIYFGEFNGNGTEILGVEF